MNKIPTLFVRDPEDRAHVLPTVNPECQWVLDGEGTATRKWDGTCVMLDAAGEWWARREVKPGTSMDCASGCWVARTRALCGITRTVGWPS